MEIRRVTSSEWEQLRAIRLAALADAPGAFGSRLEHEAGWPAEGWQAWAASSDVGIRQATFIAAEAGDWLGIATGAVHRWRPGAVLYSMWVDRGVRRRGLGRRLVEAVIEWAGSRDLPAIWLWVTEGNTAASHLYGNLGFVHTSRNEGDAEEMILRLDEMPTGDPALPLADFHLGLFAILLPEPPAGLVAGLRKRFDPASAAVAPPHITVSQPLAVPLVAARAERLHGIARECPAIEVAYGPARTFPNSTVDYLAVEPQSAVLAVRDALHSTGWFRLDLPHTDDFVAHITIREHPGANQIESEEIRNAIDLAVRPGTFTSASMVLLAPDESGHFQPTARFRLGSAGAR